MRLQSVNVSRMVAYNLGKINASVLGFKWKFLQDYPSGQKSNKLMPLVVKKNNIGTVVAKVAFFIFISKCEC